MKIRGILMDGEFDAELVDSVNYFQEQVSKWSNHNFGDQPAWKPLLGIGEELGELNHAFLKMSQGIRGNDSEHYDEMVDAVGDICVYLADFCARNDIWLGDSLLSAWNTARQRDWAKYPKNGRTE